MGRTVHCQVCDGPCGPDGRCYRCGYPDRFDLRGWWQGRNRLPRQLVRIYCLFWIVATIVVLAALLVCRR